MTNTKDYLTMSDSTDGYFTVRLGYDMIKVTSLELSKKLAAAFPEWEAPDFIYVPLRTSSVIEKDATDYRVAHRLTKLPEGSVCIPTYDLEYILDKLPELSSILKGPDDFYQASHPSKVKLKLLQNNANTACEAAGLLALRLHEEGLL